MIEQVKGRHCPVCDTLNDNGDEACKKCGLPLDSSTGNADGMLCPRCLSKNFRGSFYCYECGKYFAETEDLKEKNITAGRRNRSRIQKAPTSKIIMPNNHEITLSGDPVYIERSDFDTTLPADILMRISRQHILLTYYRGRYYVKDFGHEGKGSTNHTKVNGMDIFGKKRKALKNGDKIELAGQPELTLIFKMAEEQS